MNSVQILLDQQLDSLIVKRSEAPPPIPPASDWPPYGAHAQAAVNVSAYATNFQTEPSRTWHSKKDLVFAQHRYPTAQQVADEVADTAWMRAQNSNIKLIYYSFNQSIDPSNTSAAKHLGYEAMTDNGAVSDWRIYDSATGISLEYSNEVAGNIAANPNYEAAGMPAGSTHDNYSIAFWEKTKAKYSDQWPWDGYFADSTDYQDSFPSWELSTDGSSGNPDYDRPWSSGDTDPANFRNGLKYDAATSRSVSGVDFIWGSNGGRDGDVVNEQIGDNEWADFWDFRLTENCQDKLQLQASGNTFYVNAGNPDSRLDILFEAALVAEAMVDQTASNRLGKGVVILDFVMDWSGALPASDADVPQEQYRAARLMAGISACHDSFVFAPNLTRGQRAFPYLDEMVYDPGDPVTLDGTTPMTPSLGTIDEPTRWGVFTPRTPDQAAVTGNYGWYAQRFDGGGSGEHRLWVVNLNEPTGSGALYSDTETDSFTMPANSSGKVWARADSTYTNSSRATGGSECQDQSPLINDGSLTGATVDIQRWSAQLFVEVDA